MKELIKGWLRTKNISVMLGHHRVESLFTYEMYRFRDARGKYCMIEVVYDGFAILGTYRSLETVRLEGSVDERRPVLMYDYLDSLLQEWDDKTEFNKNPASDVTKSKLDRMVKVRMNKLFADLYATHTENFRVEYVDMVGGNVSIVVVTYSALGQKFMPLHFNIGKPSLVHKLNFGVISEEFRIFIEDIGKITGGVVWG